MMFVSLCANFELGLLNPNRTSSVLGMVHVYLLSTGLHDNPEELAPGQIRAEISGDNCRREATLGATTTPNGEQG